ncbi:YbaB/EbfC family nucleoid-associated protein [Nocardia transvalensis]|uniref:YbaB/EbfC family nucleoid-associated protein n=1 Tax=Nocardia transvalensis TaxID=37333 RepID=UPI0018930B57|nr:YbaB/EbfC family nucleoid-associated protein [Nocardia transvalensis]MBF6327536.1 YbaB/EbfC family nucleoid-associated protein [Nocardia transvalensis]
MSDGFVGDADSVLEDFQNQMRAIAEAQHQRVRLTASATSRDKRVTVTVNANGVVIDTRFSSDVDELSPDQLARLVTRTAQAAAEAVDRKNKELLAPLLDARARLPKLSELIEGMPDFEQDIPVEPPVSTAPPGSPERGDEPEAMTFTDVEEFDHTRASGRRGTSTDNAW